MKQFFLSGQPSWLQQTDVPISIPWSVLSSRRRFKRSKGPWIIGRPVVEMFPNINLPFYANIVDQCLDLGLRHATTPWYTHDIQYVPDMRTLQKQSTENYMRLHDLIPGRFLPVIHAYSPDDVDFALNIYEAYGALWSPAVQIKGYTPSVHVIRKFALGVLPAERWARRDVVRDICSRGIELHAHGLNWVRLRDLSPYIVSADSDSWRSVGRRTRMDGCNHKDCANCLRFALSWRDEAIHEFESKQVTLF